MAYKDFHVGGGGNCVFFSTAKQLSGTTHGNIRSTIRSMYDNEETKETVRACARDLIQKQYKAGLLNTMLNFELHGYNFKGRDADDKLIDKLTSTNNSELNDVLALRMLAQLTSGTVTSGPDAKLLGETRGNKTSIYSPINSDYAKGIYNAIKAASPDINLPTIYAVKQELSGDYDICIYKRDADGRVMGEEYYGENRKKPPKDADIIRVLSENNIDRSNVIGLKGEKEHCKAYIDTEVDVSNNPGLSQVTSESRSSLRAIAGFFANIYASIKSLVTSGQSIAQASLTGPILDPNDKTLDDLMVDEEIDALAKEKGVTVEVLTNADKLKKAMEDDDESIEEADEDEIEDKVEKENKAESKTVSKMEINADMLVDKKQNESFAYREEHGKTQESTSIENKSIEVKEKGRQP